MPHVSSSQDLVDRDHELCKYNYGSCRNKRATSKNGQKKLSMCTFHRHQANKYQQKVSTTQEQQKKAVSIGSPTNEIIHHPPLQVSLSLDESTNLEGTNEMLEITDFTMLSMEVMVTSTTPTVEDPFGAIDLWGPDGWFDGSF